jgi:colicin import membrane protein
MSRLEKKCFAASTGSHVLLLCLVVFGSAFFVSKRDKAPTQSTKMRVVPTKMIDAALSGGGGDPTVKPSDELQKGSPEAPPKPQPEPPKPEPPKVTPQPAPPQPEPTPPPPRTTEKKSPLPLVETKRAPKPDAKSRADSIIADLKPTKLSAADRRKAQEDAARQARVQAEREWKSQNQQLAKQIGSAVEGLSQGFEKGTVVKAYGPGGEAYANYADWVQQVYDDAWITPDMMSDEELHVEVRIVIHRSGRVIDARIEKKSGNRALDRSVQSAIDKVKTLKPFPEGSLDQQRTFNINFVPKPKRSTG